MMLRCLPICCVAVALLLSSCIDTHEEVWLQADGSGRAEINCSLPAAAASIHGGDEGIRELIAKWVKHTPAISSCHYEVGTHDSRTEIKLLATFDSALDLLDLATGDSLEPLPSAASHLAGEVDAGFNGRTLNFKRTIQPGRALPGAAFLPASQLKGHRLTYIIHLPAPALTSNATRTSDQGRTLVWDVPLNRAVLSPVVTRFTMKVPIPWKTVSVIAIPLSVIGSLAIRRIRKSRTATTPVTPEIG